MSVPATKEPTVIVGFEDATPLLDAPEQLRAQADRDGYLFFKGLLPVDDVLEVRRQLMQVIADFGWLRKDANLMEGLIDPEAVVGIENWGGTAVTLEAYRAAQKVEIFHRLSHHPRLLRIFDTLFDQTVLPHPRNIARIMISRPGVAPTPIHQDFIHIQGTRNVWTCWIPLGDVSRDLGGLAVLQGSHKLGVLAVTAAEGAGGLEAILCNVDLPWIEHDYQTGDVLTFNSCTVHKSLPSQHPERVRLSVDYRYQPVDEDIEEKSLRVHGDVATWDEVYADWPDSDLKYFWQKHTLQFSLWDESVRWQKERICD
jgi:hypothetical protein